jgi:ribosomal protein S18 acetylase RimI-like enzyme
MKINLEEIVVQKINKSNLETLISWASNEGWNPGKHDIDVFWKTDPDGFYGCFKNGELIAGGAIISYGGEFGFMGLFIVKSQYRNIGIGNKLWHTRKNLLLNRLNDGATIGMDGILAMQPYYQKGGFNVAFRDERYELKGKEYNYSDHVTTILPEDFPEIMRYDKLCFGYHRTQFLNQWLSMPDSRAIKYKYKNEIVGYAVIRRAETGYRIGPLFAQNESIAEDLLKCCLSHASEDSVFLDIPTSNENAVNLVIKYNGKYIFECARMYHGQAPNYAIQDIYGITSFELG